MSFDPFPEQPARPPRPEAPRFQLRSGAVFWRVAAIVLVVLEVVVWLRIIRPNIPFRFRMRRILALLYFTPGVAIRAFVVAAAITVIIDLVFRSIVRPLMVRWYHPRPRGLDSSHGLFFRLNPGEQIVEELPARLVQGRSARPGTLVRTSRRLAFEPLAWDAEPWSLDRAQVREVRLLKPRRRVLGLVTGYPDHVAILDVHGEETRLVVAEPSQVLSWFAPATAGLRLQTA